MDTPRGLEGRPSQSLTLAEATALLEAAEESRLHAFIVLCLLAAGSGAGAGIWVRVLEFWIHPAFPVLS